jgi:fructose-bisphosphate aldolase class II
MYFPSRSSVVTDYSTPLNELVPPGVVTGDDLLTLLEHARANGYALPAVNCTRYDV